MVAATLVVCRDAPPTGAVTLEKPLASDSPHLRNMIPPHWLKWLKALKAPPWGARASTPPPSDHQRALDLIRAIDAGGVPLHPARVNDIARRLGLHVSTRARVEDTIARIRAALQR